VRERKKKLGDDCKRLVGKNFDCSDRELSSAGPSKRVTTTKYIG
jgi:hypothetical protein